VKNERGVKEIINVRKEGRNYIEMHLILISLLIASISAKEQLVFKSQRYMK